MQLKDVAETTRDFATYYKDLYDEFVSFDDIQSQLETESNRLKFFSGISPPSLTGEELSEMIKLVTQREIRTVEIKNNKSPGTDGMPGEFSNCFAESAAAPARVFNHALSGEPPKTWSEAVISLIVLFEEGKDPSSCGGCGPVCGAFGSIRA